MQSRSIYWIEPATLRRLEARVRVPDAAPGLRASQLGRFRQPAGRTEPPVRRIQAPSATPVAAEVRPLKLPAGDLHRRLESLLDQIVEREGIHGGLILRGLAEDRVAILTERGVPADLPAFVTRLCEAWEEAVALGVADRDRLSLRSGEGRTLCLCQIESADGGRTVAALLVGPDFAPDHLEALRHALGAALLI